MIRKLSLVVLVFSAAVGTALADSKPLTPGHIQEAAIMGLNPHVFSRMDIAQIEAEPTWRDRRERIRFILEKKAKAGEDISNPYTSSGWFGVYGAMGQGRVSIGIGF
ncbi:hypothetical protein ACEUZ9_000238 [Paracoccus litorisediminis]|jgi:hypothetical protein|uniref:Uncharacterized protein n=1 Tax=Paracoccus litorisediminis TaxID=2006130 RepID=A0A844HIQ1_9RHOB|nr:hypothetical protein [Paracoccus litorisediminis]MTH57612.1 hypothetical protein [Paracoccus litorisediminis]